MKSNLTLEIIANQVGVSIATVSRVLNNKANVKASTRNEILRIVQEHELSNKVREIYQVIFIKGSEPGLLGDLLYTAIQEFCSKNDILIMTNIVTFYDQLQFLLNNMSNEQILLLGENISSDIVDTVREKTKNVAVIGTTQAFSHFFQISIDEVQAMHLLAQTILGLQHKHILYLSNKAKSVSSAASLENLKQIMEAESVKIEVYSIENDDSCYEIILDAYARVNYPTMILTPNNAVTRTCVRALGERNIAVPRDVSLVQLINSKEVVAERAVSSVIYPLSHLTKQLFRFLALDVTTLHDLHVLVPPLEIAGDTCVQKQDRGLDYTKTMTCWIGPEPLGKLEESIIKSWNSRNSDNVVVYNQVPEGASTEQVIQNAVISGTAPGIVFNLEPFFSNFLGVREVLAPLDMLNGFEEIVTVRKMERYIDLIRAKDGHVYFIPQSWTPILTACNQNALNSLGLGTPTTFQDHIELMKHLAGNRNYVHSALDRKPLWWSVAGWWNSLYMSCGGAVNQVELIDRLTSELSLEILQFLSDSIKTGGVAVHDGKEQPQKNKSIFYHHAVTPLSFAETQPELRQNCLILPPPALTNNVYVDASVKGVGLLKRQADLQDCWAFVKWLYLEEQHDVELMETTYQLPCRSDLRTNTAFAGTIERFPAFMPFIDYQERSYPIADEDKLDVFTKFALDVWEPIVTLQDTPENALRRFREENNTSAKT